VNGIKVWFWALQLNAQANACFGSKTDLLLRTRMSAFASCGHECDHLQQARNFVYGRYAHVVCAMWPSATESEGSYMKRLSPALPDGPTFLRRSVVGSISNRGRNYEPARLRSFCGKQN
jgi:hypothetical protein